MKKNAIIFGCGRFGNAAFDKLQDSYNIVAFTDNNPSHWNALVKGVEVLPPKQAFQMAKQEGMAIFVAMHESKDVVKQVFQAGIPSFYVWKEGFFVSCSGDRDANFKEQKGIRKSGTHCPYVLFVQETAHIRTHKIAKGLKDHGCKVYLAYSMFPPKTTNPEYENVYEGIIPIMSLSQIKRFVEESEFDCIHCSNALNYFTALLAQCGKTVIHDCSDLGSAFRKMTPAEMAVEYMANRLASGVVYTTEQIRQYAMSVFGLSEEKTFVLENLISRDLHPSRYLDKLSTMDGRLHCVYEGAIVGNDKASKRYFEDIFHRIAIEGVQIHFYSQSEEGYCRRLAGIHPNIHYEGNMTSSKLSEEMTKYDVGLCLYNVTERNRKFLEGASPNKIFEYVNAGLPVAVGDVRSHIDLVESNGFGKQLHMNGDIGRQLSEIARIKVEDTVLDAQIPKLLEFYEGCRIP